MGRGLVLLMCSVFVGGSACAGKPGHRASRGGNPGIRIHPVAGPPRAAPTDVPRMRELLRRYSKTGHYIVSTYDRLPTSWKLNNSTFNLGSGAGFGTYFRDDKVDNTLRYMNIAVHEIYHGFSSRMAYKLFAESGALYGRRGGFAVFVSGQPRLVKYTITYPAREMVGTYPDAARTYRFGTYVSKTAENQSTQGLGVYGLLDEWIAYYHTAVTRVDFWRWVRDESPASRRLLLDYVSGLHEAWVPYAEIKLFILHYLHHARSHRPDVYKAVMANAGFRAAFRECDDAHQALLVRISKLEPVVHAFARGKGVNASLVNGRLTYNGRPSKVRNAAYPEVVRQLSTERYRRILAALRR